MGSIKSIRTIKKTLFEIIQLLAQNENIQRLLILDSTTPLDDTFTPWEINDLFEKQYISIAPHLENGIQESGRNTFMIIQFSEMNFMAAENNSAVTGSIYIGTDKDHVLLENNKNRLFELIDEILQTIDGHKFSAAGELNVRYANSLVFSEYSFGYRIGFNFTDQATERAEL